MPVYSFAGTDGKSEGGFPDKEGGWQDYVHGKMPVENIREHKKCERIIRTNEKYFHRILEEQESGVYNRMNKGAVEIVVSVKDQNGI